MMKFCLAGAAGIAATLLGSACGDNNGGSGLDSFLPPVPAPTGEPQAAFAGEVTSVEQLLKGPAKSGLPGDYFLRNDKVSFIVQAPTRVIGPVPQGGNLVDGALLDAAGKQATDDHFGELSLIYLLGRTCEHDQIEVVADGSKGGVAAIRARGKSAPNDFVNIKGLNAFPLRDEVDPDINDGVECATTYILEPGATHVQVYHTLYNAGEDRVTGPFGILSDSGGSVETWGNLRGFERLGADSLTSLSNPAPIDYALYQGPGIAYGIIPRHTTPIPNAQFLIAGVSLMLVGNDNFLEILNPEKYGLQLDPKGGRTQRYDFAVGRDAAAVDVVLRSFTGEALTDIAGTVTASAGGIATGARVGIYRDDNGNGTIDPTDRIESYVDVDAAGKFAAKISAGNHLVRAEVKDIGRSATVPASGSNIALVIPSPVKIDYTIVDDATNMPIAGRLIVVGDHPASPDTRVFETSDRIDGIVRSLHAMRGTTTDMGDGADPLLVRLT